MMITDLLRELSTAVSFLGIIMLPIIYITLNAAPIIITIVLIMKAMKGKDIFMAWTFLTLTLCILRLPYGIVSAIIELVTYVITKDRINKANQEQTQKHGPNPGSDADFERWKQERQSRDQTSESDNGQ